MKIIVSLLFLTIVGLHNANAQVISSQKNARITQEAEPANNQVQASTTATLISGGRNPVIQEVPVEKNKQETTEPKQELISSERKPK